MRKLPIRYMLMSAFLIAVMAMYAYMFYMYRVSYDIVERMVVSSMLSKSDVLLRDISKQVTQIQTQQRQCMQDSSFDKLVFNDVSIYSRYDVHMAQLDVSAQLNMIDTTNQITDKVEAFFSDRRLAISSRTGMRRMDDETCMQLMQKIGNASLERILTYDGEQAYILTSSANLLMQRYTNTLPLSLMVTTLSKARMLQSIVDSGFSAGSQSQIILTQSGTGDVFASTLDSDRLALVKPLLEGNDGDSGYIVERIAGVSYVLTYAHCAGLGLNLYELIPEDVIFADMANIRRLILFSIGILALAILVFWGVCHRFFIKPTQTLSQAFDSIRARRFTGISKKAYTREYAHIYTGFNALIDYTNGLVEHNCQYKLLIQEAQLKQLQFQINPHFLYNCFFILRGMVQQEDYVNAERMSDLLGIYLKYITNDKRSLIPLRDEVEHAQIYTQIQHFRFSRRLSIDFHELPDELASLSVPRILLQPLIENAFLHGMKHVESGGLICVRFQTDARLVSLIVEDNGASVNAQAIREIQELIEGKPPQAQSESVALINIHRRLRLLYGEPAGLYAEQSALGGLKITARIPIAKEGESHVQNADRR